MKKRSRFKRESKDYTPGERDIAIIHAVHQCRFLTASQVGFLFPEDRHHLSHRLRNLFDGGFLDRPGDQPKSWGQDLTHALDRKGAELLEELYNHPIGRLDWREKNRTAKQLTLKHDLMVSEFAVILRKACEPKPDVKLLRFQVNDRSGLRTQFKRRSETITLTPDGFFVLRLPDGDIPYFLEADRGNEIQDIYLEKLRKYFLFWFPSSRNEPSPFQRTYGFKNFRVLTLTLTSERRDNLLERSKEIRDSQSNPIWTFWFATAEDIQRENPLSIFNRIWRNPRDTSQKLSLLR